MSKSNDKSSISEKLRYKIQLNGLRTLFGEQTFTRLSPLLVLTTLLIAIGLSATLLKHNQLYIPFTPDTSADLWLVEAELRFEGKDRPAKISLSLPDETPAISILEESYISRAYGLSVLTDDTPPRIATWTRRRAPDSMQSLYYRLDLHHTFKSDLLHSNRGLKVPSFPKTPHDANKNISITESIPPKNNIQNQRMYFEKF